MDDLTFLVEFSVSIAAVVLPIILIVRLLANPEDFAVSDLFILPIVRRGGPLPPEEETPPRWRPERISPRHRASQPVTSSRLTGRSSSPSVTPADQT